MAKKSPSFSGNPALVGLGAAIRAARQAQGLSQKALAELAGIDRFTWVELKEMNTI